MKNYSYVLEFSKEHVDRKYIDQALHYAWKYTPSKNNFMNYSVYVLGPTTQKLRQSLYYKCLQQQAKANKTNITSLHDYDMLLREQGLQPNFTNILSAPYILFYTQRVENSLNTLQQTLINEGMVYEQTFPQASKKYFSAGQTARIEIGMFSTNFSTKCLDVGLDISYISCFPSHFEEWKQAEWHFITHNPLLIQLVGYGKIYRKDIIDSTKDRKPSYERIVNKV